MFSLLFIHVALLQTAKRIAFLIKLIYFDKTHTTGKRESGENTNTYAMKTNTNKGNEKKL